MESAFFVDPVLYQGRPADAAVRAPRERAVYDLLDALGIAYRRVDHDPAATIADCAEIDRLLGVDMCKNLFLCNAQKTAVLPAHDARGQAVPYKGSVAPDPVRPAFLCRCGAHGGVSEHQPGRGVGAGADERRGAPGAAAHRPRRGAGGLCRVPPVCKHGRASPLPRRICWTGFCPMSGTRPPLSRCKRKIAKPVQPFAAGNVIYLETNWRKDGPHVEGKTGTVCEAARGGGSEPATGPAARHLLSGGLRAVCPAVRGGGV